MPASIRLTRKQSANSELVKVGWDTFRGATEPRAGSPVNNVTGKEQVKRPGDRHVEFSPKTGGFRQLVVRHNHQAIKPENRIPTISATVERRPNPACANPPN